MPHPQSESYAVAGAEPETVIESRRQSGTRQGSRRS